MKGHVGDEALLDLLNGGGALDAVKHAADCPTCAAWLKEARALVDRAREVDVPEPPPLFWEAFRRNLNRRIAEERRHSAWRTWLVPAALSAAAVVAVIGFESRFAHAPAVPAVGSAALPAWSALPPTDEDEALPVLEGLASGAGDSAWDAEPGLGPFLAGLSEEQSRTLAEALQSQGREVKL